MQNFQSYSKEGDAKKARYRLRR